MEYFVYLESTPQMEILRLESQYFQSLDVHYYLHIAQR
jgi:hypothetical protein